MNLNSFRGAAQWDGLYFTHYSVRTRLLLLRRMLRRTLATTWINGWRILGTKRFSIEKLIPSCGAWTGIPWEKNILELVPIMMVRSDSSIKTRFTKFIFLFCNGCVNTTSTVILSLTLLYLHPLNMSL